MSANLENSAVATGLGKVSFHSNPKEGQCQGMFCTAVLISLAGGFVLGVIRAGLQRCVG